MGSAPTIVPNRFTRVYRMVTHLERLRLRPLLFLTLTLSPITLLAVDWPWARLEENNVNGEAVKEGLSHLALLGPEDQVRLINEAKPQLKPDALRALYDQAKEDGPVFLKELLLAKYPSKEEQQKLINGLQKAPTYGDFLQNPSQNLCSQVEKTANPVYFGAIPVIDWLNTAHFKGFFNPGMTYTLANRPCHNDFDTFNQWNLSIEPYGFYTQFRNEPDPLKFDQYTIGVSAVGEYTFFDRLVLGLGLAYSHSGIDWKEVDVNASLNSLYFGPALHYVFSHGYLGCTLFGVANFYHTVRKTDLFPGVAVPQDSLVDSLSWDLDFRIEGGLAFEPGYQFFLYPMFRLDYLTVFENGATEYLEDDSEIAVEGFIESFLCAKVGVEMTREFYTDSLGFVVPSLSFGWLNFSPISTEDYRFHLGECTELKGKVEPNSWNQYYFGAGLSVILKKGMLFALDYELTAGADSPVQAGSLRFELSW